MEKETEQLRLQQVQLRDQIEGLYSQIAAQESQKSLISQELDIKSKLQLNGLVSASDLIELKREFFRLDGASGQLRANVAEAMTKISGIEIQILRLSQNRQEEAISRLRDLKYSEIELEERRNGLLQRYERLALRSPVDGVVFGKRTFNKKSVVRAAEPIMYIVPDWAPLQISVRVEPIDIDQVFPGQPANLRFTSFDQRLTPEVSGTVIRVSAGTVSDDVSRHKLF